MLKSTSHTLTFRLVNQPTAKLLPIVRFIRRFCNAVVVVTGWSQEPSKSRYRFVLLSRPRLPRFIWKFCDFLHATHVKLSGETVVLRKASKASQILNLINTIISTFTDIQELFFTSCFKNQSSPQNSPPYSPPSIFKLRKAISPTVYSLSLLLT